jgi:hypothetical protein
VFTGIVPKFFPAAIDIQFTLLVLSAYPAAASARLPPSRQTGVDITATPLAAVVILLMLLLDMT